MYRGMVTFSRGGMITGLADDSAFVVFPLADRNFQGGQAKLYFLV
jgi:hypothetical protein